MKLNWGHGIAIFYATFMVVLLYFVIKSTTHDNSLVMDNYYEQDLKYQSHYDKVVNTQQLKEQVDIRQDTKAATIVIQFPKGMKGISGTAQLFRPSTKHKDRNLIIKTDENNNMLIPTGGLQAGRWQLKLNWESGETPFYTEEDLEL